MKSFLVELACLHCGAELTTEGTPRVSAVEAVVHAVCPECRSEATIRVMYTNRRAPAALPAVTMGASFAGVL